MELLYADGKRELHVWCGSGGEIVDIEVVGFFYTQVKLPALSPILPSFGPWVPMSCSRSKCPLLRVRYSRNTTLTTLASSSFDCRIKGESPKVCTLLRAFVLFSDALCVLRNRLKECRDIAHFIRTDFMIYGISARYERGVELRNDFSTAFSHDSRHHRSKSPCAMKIGVRRAAGAASEKKPAGKRQVTRERTNAADGSGQPQSRKE